MNNEASDVLKKVVERFIQASDQSDLSTITAMYEPTFVNIRVTDEGQMIRLTLEQLFVILGRPGGHKVPTQSTTIHHIEVINDMGFVLLTRMKDLGKGWEPMFYSLVWKKDGNTWLLLREFVHQRSMPKNR